MGKILQKIFEQPTEQDLLKKFKGSWHRPVRGDANHREVGRTKIGGRQKSGSVVKRFREKVRSPEKKHFEKMESQVQIILV